MVDFYLPCHAGGIPQDGALTEQEKQTMTQFYTFAAPAGRVLLALIFILSGAQKITGYAGTQGYMEAFGVPGALLPIVIVVELVAGVALIIGWQARIAAFLLAGFSLVSGLIFHYIPSTGMEGMEAQMQMIMFMKNISIAGGLLMVVSLGAGAFALDTRKTSA